MNIDFLRAAFSGSADFDLGHIVVQAAWLVLMSSIVSAVYYFTGNSLSNRSRLAAIFPLMALTTMLIISVIKSSLALSLGLVGALSIVRFRAAIKDPEELSYIFLTIALGLGFGADQLSLTSVFFGITMVVLVVQALLKGQFGKLFSDKDSVHVEFSFGKSQKLSDVTAMLEKHCVEIRLTRMSEGDKQQTMMFLVKPKSVAALEAVRKESLALDSHAKLTVLQYQPLV